MYFRAHPFSIHPSLLFDQMSSFSILPLGGFISVSLSMSYLRENNRAQRLKRDARRHTSDIQNSTETWRNVPESIPHGAHYLYKSLEAAAIMLRMGSETVRQVISPAEHKLFYETLLRLEQRGQLCNSYLDKTVVIEGIQGCGASTLIKNLVAATSNSKTLAVESSSIHWKGILDLRQKLQCLPVPLLASFQSVCDYCRIVDVEEHHPASAKAARGGGADDVVFIERLYHSRVSHILCGQETPAADPSHLPASAFQWPKDLPVPALVIYIVLPHDERGQRAGQKPISLGEYNKIQLIHSKVRGAPFEAIDGSGSPEDVLDTVLQCCESRGLCFRSSHHALATMMEDDEEAASPVKRRPVDDEKSSGSGSDDTPEDTEHPIIINLSDAHPPRSRERRELDRRESKESNKRHSMGWYGAFMSGGDE